MMRCKQCKKVRPVGCFLTGCPNDNHKRTSAPSFVLGWAVIQSRQILIRTVTNTRIGAIVNYLGTVHEIQVTGAHSEEEIERAWLRVRGHTLADRAECVRVTVDVFR